MMLSPRSSPLPAARCSCYDSGPNLRKLESCRFMLEKLEIWTKKCLNFFVANPPCLDVSVASRPLPFSSSLAPWNRHFPGLPRSWHCHGNGLRGCQVGTCAGVGIKPRVKLAEAKAASQQLPPLPSPVPEHCRGKSKTNYPVCLLCVCLGVCLCVSVCVHERSLLWHRLKTIVSAWLSPAVTSQTV